MLEKQCERVTCVCGISIRARYREQHEQTKRHKGIVTLLRDNSTASATAKTSVPDIVPDVTVAKDEANGMMLAASDAGVLSAIEMLEGFPNSGFTFTGRRSRATSQSTDIEMDFAKQLLLSPRSRCAHAADIVFRLPHAMHTT